MDVIKETEGKMAAAIDHLKHELQGLRTGRASASLVDQVHVEVYGTQMRLQDVASISIPESRQILITPFDANNVHAIAKGLEEANLGIQPVVDGNAVRMKIPEMDASVRQEMCKQAKKRCEEAKVSVRNARRDGNDTVKRQKNSGEIPEDVMKKHEKRIQDLTDKFCKIAEELTSDKEKEITTI